MKLIKIKDIATACPWWPYSHHGTWRLIRLARLRCVIVGRNKFVTEELLHTFVEEHTRRATKPLAANREIMIDGETFTVPEEA